MKGCHTCAYKAAVDAGMYKDRKWEDTPCASCEISTGGFAVEYNEEQLDEDTYMMKSEEGLKAHLPVEVMGQFVTGLLSLRPELRDVVSMRFSGLKYEEIAEKQGVTMACVEKRHRRAMELWPALREMFPEKVAKRKRRKIAASPRIRDTG